MVPIFLKWIRGAFRPAPSPNPVKERRGESAWQVPQHGLADIYLWPLFSFSFWYSEDSLFTTAPPSPTQSLNPSIHIQLLAYGSIGRAVSAEGRPYTVLVGSWGWVARVCAWCVHLSPGAHMPQAPPQTRHCCSIVSFVYRHLGLGYYVQISKPC